MNRCLSDGGRHNRAVVQPCWPTFVTVFCGVTLYYWCSETRVDALKPTLVYVYFSKLQRILHILEPGYPFHSFTETFWRWEQQQLHALLLKTQMSRLLPLLELLAWKHRPKDPEHNPPGTKANTRFPSRTYKLMCGRPPGNTNQRVCMESI